jgi:hypothetical protein
MVKSRVQKYDYESYVGYLVGHFATGLNPDRTQCELLRIIRLLLTVSVHNL